MCMCYEEWEGKKEKGGGGGGEVERGESHISIA